MKVKAAHVFQRGHRSNSYNGVCKWWIAGLVLIMHFLTCWQLLLKLFLPVALMCGCTDTVNSSWNRPPRAHRVPSGNSMRWNGFLAATLGVSGFLRTGKGSFENENNLPAPTLPAGVVAGTCGLCGALVAFTTPKPVQWLNSRLSLRGEKRGRVRASGLGFLQPLGVVVVFQREASRKGECAWRQSSTRAAGREDAGYNNKQMLRIDYDTAVRTGKTKGGDPQRRLWRLQLDLSLEFWFCVGFLFFS